MVPLFQHLLFHHFQIDLLFFSLKSNESVRLPSPKSTIVPLLFTAGISCQYWHKLPDCFQQLLLYSIKVYINIIISIPLALTISTLFISLLQSVNSAQFLNITFLLALFASASAAAVLLAVIVLLTSMYHHYNQTN